MSRSTWMAGLALAAFMIAGAAGSAPAQNWAPQTSGTVEDLNAVWFRTPAAGWAVGNAGTSLVTVDAGQTWTPVNLVAQDLHDVAFLDPAVGLIVGDNGVILRTTNGGTNWAPVASGTGSQLRAVAFGAGGAAYAAGRDGTILRSTNAGAAWVVVETGTVRYLGATASGAQLAWIVGEGGVIRATTNGGASWFNQPSGTTSDLKGISTVGAEGWIAGSNSTVLYTANGGTSWAPRSTGIAVGLDAVHFVNATEGWVVGGGGAIYHTANGGVTWVPETSNTTNDLQDVHFGANLGWSVGVAGTIRFRGAAAAIDDPIAASARPGLVRSYPNPFRSAVSIEVELARAGRASLRVYDTLGRLVATLAEGEMGAGRSTFAWEAAGFERGVYFYRLETSAGTITQKIVLAP